MEALFKKYFWVVNLVVLTVVAYLVAQTVVNHYASKYLSAEHSEVMLTAENTQVQLLEKADGNRVGELLINRRPFNVEPEKEEAVDCKPDCTGKQCGSDGCDGTCGGDCPTGERCNVSGQCEVGSDESQASKLEIKLLGTWVNPVDPSYSFANVLLKGSNTTMVEVGSEVMGEAKVVDILPKFLLLQEGDRLTHVGLWGEAPDTKKKPGRIRPMGSKRPSPTTSARASIGGRGRSKYDFSKGVKKVGDFDYTIDRQMLDEQLADLTQLGMQARVIPNYRKGKYEGFKLVGVRPGSLYRAIGIRSGDIIRSINGSAINSPNKAMELFTQLKMSSTIKMEVERRGKIETFNYNIQ
jgi:general secretion pathway protein C